MILVLLVLALVFLVRYQNNQQETNSSQIVWINNTSEADLQPEIKRILPIIVLSVNSVIPNKPTIYITSTTGGVHMYGSLHPEGKAIDFDIPNWSDGQRETIAENLDFSVGYGYDVIDEGTHIHTEYDPK